MESVFLSLYETNERMYESLENRIMDELSYDMNRYLIKTCIVEKSILIFHIIQWFNWMIHNIMDFTLDVMIPKNNIEKANLSEVLVEWAGEYYSQEPRKYSSNSKLVFEQYIDTTYFEYFVGTNFDIDEWVAFRLKGENLQELE